MGNSRNSSLTWSRLGWNSQISRDIFQPNSYTDGIIPINYSILCCISDSNLKYRTYLYRLLFQNLPWFCRKQPFHNPPRRAAIQLPAAEASGAGSPWQAPHLYTRMAVFEGNLSRPDRRKNSPADDPGCFFGGKSQLQIVLLLQDYTDQAAAALVDDPFDGLLQLDAGVAGHPAELVVQPLVDQLMQALAKDV